MRTTIRALLRTAADLVCMTWPPTARHRRTIVCLAAIAATLATIVLVPPSRPVPGLVALGAIFLACSVALPAPWAVWLAGKATARRRARKAAEAAEHAAFVARARYAQDQQRLAPPGFEGVSSYGIPRHDWVRFCREVDSILAGSDGQP